MKRVDFENGTITSNILGASLPMLVAQILSLLYNIVDRIYIGRIPDVGSLALTGVGVTFPIITIISAFAGFASGGGAPLAAIALGQKNRERAEKILGSSTSLLLFFSVLLTAFFFVFQTPLLYLFGASDNTIGYASTYISIYLVGTVFVELAVGLNTFISCQGHARTAMCSVLIGAVVNIGLDPVFIFVLHMGVSGAALATVLSQALSAAWVLRFLTSKKSGIRLSLRTMKPDFAILGSVMALGISPFIMSATESAITIVMNHGLQTYGGDLYVGSMTILQSVLQLIFVPVNGFTNGVQPIISYNFGAGQFDRVRQTIRRAAAPGYAVFPQDGRDARRHVLQSRRVRQLAGDPLVEQAHLRQILFCPHRPPLLNRPSAPPAAISLFRRHLRRIFGILHRLRRILRGVLRHI